MKTYFKITTQLNKEKYWWFALECNNRTEINDKLIQETVCNHHKVSISLRHAVTYQVTALSKTSYDIWGLSKFTTASKTDTSFADGLLLTMILRAPLPC